MSAGGGRGWHGDQMKFMSGMAISLVGRGRRRSGRAWSASEAVHAVAGVGEAEIVAEAAADDLVVAGDAVRAQDRVGALAALEGVGVGVAADEVGAGAA